MNHPPDGVLNPSPSDAGKPAESYPRQGIYRFECRCGCGGKFGPVTVSGFVRHPQRFAQREAEAALREACENAQAQPALVQLAKE